MFQPDSENKADLLKKVECSELKSGMFVQELDRPWLETPFMFQGFCIRSIDEITVLQKYCKYVYINVDKSEVNPAVTHMPPAGGVSASTQVRDIAIRAGAVSRYEDTVEVEQELETAKRIHEDSRSAIRNIFATVHDEGELNLPEVLRTTSAIVDSVLRNPDAFMLLQRMRSRDHYRYTHAINCCALAATFCRHMGFSRDEIQDISTGALLLDIGMTRMPDSMMDKESAFNELSLKLVRHHVQFGLEVLDRTAKVPRIARDMLLAHHERVNGEGYPNSLRGEHIPVCGRIAAIVDCYDAMISNRPHRKGISPTAAVCTMYNWRNIDFHEDLIEQFIQCIGAYPTGTLVQLSSGQVGIVLSQNRVRRLYPKVLLILNADGEKYEQPVTVDLWDYAARTKGAALEISKVVDADETGIDPADYYL
jgi:HD-GYP domain-containing protein (c-di-GMP phosphodiesterase class II)